jgi:hypothetical protein
VGDEIVVDTDPAPGEQPARLRIEVTEIDGMRIETVHVRVEAAPSEEDEREQDERERNGREKSRREQDEEVAR